MDIKQLIKQKIILLDGAMGTMLIKNGADLNLCPEILNITNPRLITDIHRQYINSGSEIIYANTFGANSKKIPANYKLEDVIKAALNNAKTAASKCLVAYDMGPIGQLLEPQGSLSFDGAYGIFKEQAVLAQKYGADLIVIETLTDLYEMKAALLAVKENTSLPVFCTMSFEKNKRTFQGTDIRSMAITLEGLGADAIGINCSLGPDGILPIAKELLKWTNLPVIVKANAGMPQPDGKTYSCGADTFKDIYKEFLEMGVSIIGGCCGTTPEYIAKLKEISGKEIVKKPENVFSAVCSAGKTVKIEGVKVIGERLNPTGKKLYREALIKGDTGYIISQALSQCEAGADILDVNAGLPQIDETQVMAGIIQSLQAVTDTPLQIDSSNPLTIEKALRYYNGKPIVNSVSGDDETLDKILPLVKKYGASVVGLTLDKNGLPKTAKKRMEIAEKIINCAKKYGIGKKDVFIDPLALTVSTEQEQADNTLKAVKELNNMGIRTLLGISNVSFGLPQREYINLAFMTAALQCGLNLPIINPQSEIMMGAVNAFKIINGQDKNAEYYAEKYGAQAENAKPAEVSEKNIEYCIIKGLKPECAAATIKLLENNNPLDVVNGYIIPALDKVGSLFDKGTLFLPQLIRSAETAKCAFDEIKLKMPKKSLIAADKIIMATVKGDIHDIGKNIVKTVLENYGYEIIDLGKNVSSDVIINAAKEHNVKLVGLSALMTTTVKNMQEIIKDVRQSGLNCFVMAGGAVLTEDYAKEIGADFYAKDANGAVKIAKTVFKGN